jgi:CIC family chloride channel protein
MDAAFSPGTRTEYYETLSLGWRFLLPVLGAVSIGAVFHFIARHHNIQVGIVHVMERLAYHQGHLPFRNLVLQFLGAAVALFSGHSAGREGPCVHLGAASASVTGRTFGLPNNSIRVLVGCGVAAAIAASFNTPLAGVIFAMEVVIMEYTLASFTPVILASVTATTLTRMVFKDDIGFSVPEMELKSLTELPFIVFMGLVIGTIAAIYIKLLESFSQWSTNKPVFLRLTLAGVGTGLVAIFLPDIMGIGYDTVNESMTGQITRYTVVALVALLLAKILVTTFSLGMGIPAGLIGPSLFIGALAGVLMGLLAGKVYGESSSVGYYGVLGMGAMMAATLQAPLAALTAMLELSSSQILTSNPKIILPGMLIVVVASMTTRELFGKKSVFLVLMQARGLDYRKDPISQSLLRLGVAGAMDRNVETLPAELPLASVQKVLDKNPRWILITEDNEPRALMPGSDLARQYVEIVEHTDETEAIPESINLLTIPAKRMEVTPIELQANLQQALEQLDQTGADVVYVTRASRFGKPYTYGILTRDLIEDSYRKVV